MCSCEGPDGEEAFGLWYAEVSKCFLRPQSGEGNTSAGSVSGLIMGADTVALKDPRAFLVVTWFVRQEATSGKFLISMPWAARMQSALGGRGATNTGNCGRVSVFKRLDVSPYDRKGTVVKVTSVLSKVRMVRWSVPGHSGKGDLFVLSPEDEERVIAQQKRRDFAG